MLKAKPKRPAQREWKVCAACDGRGHVFGYHGDYMTCTACKATGRIRLTPPKPRRK